MAKKWVLLVLALQVGALVYMAGQREYIRAFGERIYIRTAPVDPRAPFRGDYVQLRYAFSTVQAEDFRDADGSARIEKGRKVYAVLKNDGSGVYVLDYLTDREPAGGVFLQGRTTYDYRVWRGAGIGIKYGIEQYFVEQGRGRDIEERLGRRGEMQVPMEVEAALGAGGIAVLVGYRWSDLGVQIEMLRSNSRGPDGEVRDPAIPLSPLVRLSYQNVSDQPLAIVNNDNNCGLLLEAAEWSSVDVSVAGSMCDGYQPSPQDIIVLQPDEIYARELELSDPRWHVNYEGQTVEIGELPLNAMFRLAYRAPAFEAESASPAPLWRGRLPSQAFNAVGRID